MSTWTYALLLVGLGVLLGLLYFLSGMSRGLGKARRRVVSQPHPHARACVRTQQARGLLAVMAVSLVGGILLGRPAMLILGVACLALAYWFGRD